jgi:hypothetical protein
VLLRRVEQTHRPRDLDNRRYISLHVVGVFSTPVIDGELNLAFTVCFQLLFVAVFCCARFKLASSHISQMMEVFFLLLVLASSALHLRSSGNFYIAVAIQILMKNALTSK